MRRFPSSLLLTLVTALYSRAEDPAPLQPDLEIPEPESMVPETYPFQHDDPIVAVAWAPDGTKLVACDEGGKIGIWQSSGRRLKLWEDTKRPAGSSPLAVAWSPDGELIVTGIENEVVLWNASTGAEIRRLRCRQRVVSLAFLPDSRKLVIAGIDGELKLADLAGIPDIVDLPSPSAHIEMVVVSTDGKKLAVAGQAPQVSILNLPGGEASMTFGPGDQRPQAARWVAWKELDSSLFADTPGLGLCEIDATSGQQTDGYALNWMDSMIAAASPKSGQFVVGISSLGHTFCHRARTQSVEWSFDIPKPVHKWVEISPDGKRVALPWGPRAIAIAATGDGRLLAGKPLFEPPQRVAWSRDGKTVFSTRGTCEVHAFDATTGRRLRGYIAPGYRNLGLVSRDDGALLAVTRGGAWLRVTDLTTSHDLVREVESISSNFAAIAWDGSTFAWKSAGEKIQVWDGTSFTWKPQEAKIRIWDLVAGEELPSIEPLTPSNDLPLLDAQSKEEAVFTTLSPKGDFVLQVDKWGGRTIWTDTATGRVLRDRPGLRHGGRQMTAASFSPDGSWTAILSKYDCAIVATGNDFPLEVVINPPWAACAFSPDSRLFAILFDGSLHIYDPATPANSVMLKAQGNAVAFAWSPDASRIATLSEHGVTRIWKTPAMPHGPSKRSEPIHDWGDLACQRADRSLAAARRLEAAGPAAVALLRNKFAEKENPAHIADLVQQLRNEVASSRDAAREELTWMGVQAEAALATEMSRVEPGAYRNELESLLCQAESRVGPSPQNLRRQRAMQVLESIGSAEALDALRHLSGESPSLRERADAESAVRRVEMKASR